LPLQMNIIVRSISHFASCTMLPFIDWIYSLFDPQRTQNLGNNYIGFFESMGGRESLVFWNIAFGYDLPQLLPSNYLMVGPLSDPKPPAPLTAELKEWLDAADDVVFINLGTSGYLQQSRLEALIRSLDKLTPKYRVLWRSKQLDNVSLPSHIKVVQWLPSQACVLDHPHIRVFVTHAGLNSPQEALLHGLPMVALPLYADQGGNADRIVLSGAGLSAGENYENVHELISQVDNNTFRQNAKRVGRLLQLHKTRSNVDLAVDKIEEVLEIGYEHLIPALAPSTFQYLKLDIVFVYIVVVLAYSVVLMLFFKICCFSKKQKNAVPQDKKKN